VRSALQPIRLVSVGAFCTWLLLSALAYQQIPAFEFAWAGNTLEYLPEWLGWLLALLALLTTTEEARAGAVRASQAVEDAVARIPQPALDGLILVAATAALWLLRERGIFAHSDRVVLVLSNPDSALFATGGAPWLLHRFVQAALSMGLPAMASVQALNCVLGALAIVFVTRAARTFETHIAFGPLPLLVFSAGLLRAVGGRADSQPLFLAAAALCLWRALESLRGRASPIPTAVTFGIAAALHPLGRFLLPGLVAVAWLSRPGEPTSIRVRATGAALLVALVPIALQAAIASATTEGIGISAALLGRGESGWVRFAGPPRRITTDYLLFSQSHLKYLANSLLLLAPAAAPLIVGAAVVRRGRIAATAATQFLCVSCASLLVGASLLRPIGGPFDWDLLSVAAVHLAFLAGALIVAVGDTRVRTHLFAAAIGLQILFFGIPFSAMAFGTANEAGPFVENAYPSWTPYSAERPPRRTVGPWL
jgi:hypothetical protein